MTNTYPASATGAWPGPGSHGACQGRHAPLAQPGKRGSMDVR
jgi:hypothetical protein